MTKLNITNRDRLEVNGQGCRYDARHESTTYWICDKTNEKHCFTDKQLPEEIAAGRVKLIRLEVTCCPNGDSETRSPTHFVPFDSRSGSDQAEAIRRYAYVHDARQRGLSERDSAIDLLRSIGVTAHRMCDMSPPAVDTLRRWIKRAGQRPRLST